MEQKTIAKNKESHESKLIAVIRIKGDVKIKSEIRETFNRMRLRRKYSCVLINSSDKTKIGMLKQVKFFVAYGDIEKSILEKLISARAINDPTSDKKTKIKEDAGKIADELMKGKKLKDFGLKQYFRLHPPRKGIDSKLQYPKGVLGNNKADINKLIERML